MDDRTQKTVSGDFPIIEVPDQNQNPTLGCVTYHDCDVAVYCATPIQNDISIKIRVHSEVGQPLNRYVGINEELSIINS